MNKLTKHTCYSLFCQFKTDNLAELIQHEKIHQKKLNKNRNLTYEAQE